MKFKKAFQQYNNILINILLFYFLHFLPGTEIIFLYLSKHFTALSC